MTKSVIVIGGGIAGMAAASALSRKGIKVTIIEKEDHTGGHLGKWDRLFPNFRKSDEVTHFIEEGLSNVTIRLNTVISNIEKQNGSFIVKCGEEDLTGDAILVATGFELFDCRKKEEYGYGIYDNVMTSADLEKIFRSGRELTTTTGKKPARIGIIHCVGSRDEKAGNLYCSKVCCITGVKQAIEIKEQFPDAEIYCFYMDLRMFDRHFEEMYLEAQQKWDIHFIRGRLSEAAENADRSIVLKVEDTLAGLPLKLTVDMVVLLAGIIPSPGTKIIATMLGLGHGEDGFLNPVDEHTLVNTTAVTGVFITGAVKGPSSVTNTIADAAAAAIQVENYINRLA